jgi:micrococcal nuclease
VSKFLQILLGVFLVSSVGLNIYQYTKENRGDLIKVIDVIDGDTFLVENNRKIRLAGVEAPESGLCGSTESAKLLRSLIEGNEVKIVPITTDAYGRNVASVYVGNIYVNKEIISSGWASFNYTKLADREDISKVNKEAIESEKGIYGTKCTQVTNPEKPKCVIKGNINAKGERTYLFPGCASYQISKVQLHLGESWFCTEKEAEKAGFTKNSVCYGKSY